MSTQRNDNKIRTIQAIDSIPIGVGVSSSGVFTIKANNWGYIYVTTTPSDQRLTLWDFNWSLYIDVDRNDDYEWPNGNALSSSSKSTSDLAYKINVSHHTSWGRSYDATNVRVNVFKYVSTDGSDHNGYFYFKAYKQAGVQRS